MSKFKFIDLFAGIGGFHIAMEKLGGECVFASEIDPEAIKTYYDNFKINAAHDITTVNADDIPEFDILCAGFPCQAFSKAGHQKGFSDTRGTLFFDIERILKHHLLKYKKPKMIILENVRNLVSHDEGNTWETIRNSLHSLGFVLTEEPLIVSPHYFGIPQLRERVLIFGIHKDYCSESKIEISINKLRRNSTSAVDIVDTNITTKDYKISDYEEKILNAWDEFISGINRKTIGFPIWFDFMISNTSISNFPKWKKDFVLMNRNLYSENKNFIDEWAGKYDNLQWATPTDRKFEWQAGESITSLWEGIIQFRPSGIRVKRPTEFPALVAMVHIPIIGWEKRRLSPKEAANLQSFPRDFILNEKDKAAYKQLGNAVNTEVIFRVSKSIIEKQNIKF